MKTELFYFTGTGNSLFAAKAIAQRLDGALLPIASFLNDESVFSDADRIGIVFPVYFEDLPLIVEDFAGKLHASASQYIFAVCTFGGAAGWSLRHLKKVLALRGLRLSAGFGVQMPQNSFSKPHENRDKLYESSLRRFDMIAKKARDRKKGMFYSNRFNEAVISLLKPLVVSLCRKQFLKLSGGSPRMTTKELLYRTDHSYRTNQNCIKCGICADVCPAGNITLADCGPVWQHRCETCLACFNWCPRHAIEGGVSPGAYYYRYPGTGFEQIAEQRKKVPV